MPYCRVCEGCGYSWELELSTIGSDDGPHAASFLPKPSCENVQIFTLDYHIPYGVPGRMGGQVGLAGGPDDASRRSVGGLDFALPDDTMLEPMSPPAPNMPVGRCSPHQLYR